MSLSVAANVALLAVRVALAAVSGSLSMVVATLDAVLDVVSSGGGSRHGLLPGCRAGRPGAERSRGALRCAAPPVGAELRALSASRTHAALRPAAIIFFTSFLVGWGAVGTRGASASRGAGDGGSRSSSGGSAPAGGQLGAAPSPPPLPPVGQAAQQVRLAGGACAHGAAGRHW